MQHGEPQQRLHIDVVRLHLEGDEHVGFTRGVGAPAWASLPRGPCSNVRTVSPGMSGSRGRSSCDVSVAARARRIARRRRRTGPPGLPAGGPGRRRRASALELALDVRLAPCGRWNGDGRQFRADRGTCAYTRPPWIRMPSHSESAAFRPVVPRLPAPLPVAPRLLRGLDQTARASRHASRQDQNPSSQGGVKCARCPR